MQYRVRGSWAPLRAVIGCGLPPSRVSSAVSRASSAVRGRSVGYIALGRSSGVPGRLGATESCKYEKAHFPETIKMKVSASGGPSRGILGAFGLVYGLLHRLARREATVGHLSGNVFFWAVASRGPLGAGVHATSDDKLRPPQGTARGKLAPSHFARTVPTVPRAAVVGLGHRILECAHSGSSARWRKIHPPSPLPVYEAANRAVAAQLATAPLRLPTLAECELHA